MAIHISIEQITSFLWIAASFLLAMTYLTLLFGHPLSVVRKEILSSFFCFFLLKEFISLRSVFSFPQYFFAPIPQNSQIFEWPFPRNSQILEQIVSCYKSRNFLIQSVKIALGNLGLIFMRRSNRSAISLPVNKPSSTKCSAR